MHACYLLKSSVCDRVYIGYTVDFPRRIRQHNGEIVGGAKKTKRFRPWIPVCVVYGFKDNHSALRFEYRLQHAKPRRRSNMVEHTIDNIFKLIDAGDGPRGSWGELLVAWY